MLIKGDRLLIVVKGISEGRGGLFTHPISGLRGGVILTLSFSIQAFKKPNTHFSLLHFRISREP